MNRLLTCFPFCFSAAGAQNGVNSDRTPVDGVGGGGGGSGNGAEPSTAAAAAANNSACSKPDDELEKLPHRNSSSLGVVSGYLINKKYNTFTACVPI